MKRLISEIIISVVASAQGRGAEIDHEKGELPCIHRYDVEWNQ